MKMEEAKEIAKSLFGRINWFIAETGREQNWLDAQGRLLALVNLSTDEKWARKEPWKGIFYLRFFYGGDDEKPVMVGMGSFAASEVTLDGNFVPHKGEIVNIFRRLGFGIITPMNPYMTFDEMKNEVLPSYQLRENEKAEHIAYMQRMRDKAHKAMSNNRGMVIYGKTLSMKIMLPEGGGLDDIEKKIEEELHVATGDLRKSYMLTKEAGGNVDFGSYGPRWHINVTVDAPEEEDFLERLRRFCKKHGILLNEEGTDPFEGRHSVLEK